MKKLFLSIILVFGFAAGAMAQSFSLTYAAELPSFEGGGVSAFTRKVQEVLSESPVAGMRRGGTVTVGFYITREGNLRNSTVVDGLGKAADEAVLYAVRETEGLWTPALDNAGNPLDWYVTIQLQIPKNE